MWHPCCGPGSPRCHGLAMWGLREITGKVADSIEWHGSYTVWVEQARAAFAAGCAVKFIKLPRLKLSTSL